MHKLIQGLHHFQKEVVTPQADFFRTLGDGQSPETLFITCSDSRIDPNLLTQTQPGELFIIRNAGNMIPKHGTPPGGVIASIEYAVMALGVQHVVVCGHSHCGALQGILKPELVESLPLVKQWLSHSASLRQNIQSQYSELHEEEQLSIAIQENVLTQLENLQSWPFIQERLAGGTLQLHGWVYKIDTGEAYVYDPSQEQFVPSQKLAAIVS